MITLLEHRITKSREIEKISLDDVREMINELHGKYQFDIAYNTTDEQVESRSVHKQYIMGFLNMLQNEHLVSEPTYRPSIMRSSCAQVIHQFNFLFTVPMMLSSNIAETELFSNLQISYRTSLRKWNAAQNR
jgi:hypothetical protein